MPLEEINVVDSFVWVDGSHMWRCGHKQFRHGKCTFKIDYLFENEVLQLVVIQVQVALWKPHHWTSIC